MKCLKAAERGEESIEADAGWALRVEGILHQRVIAETLHQIGKGLGIFQW